MYYGCGNLCGKKLSCENHLCQKPCHIGQCDPCIAVSVNRCPCGKRQLTEEELNNRTLCTQPIPTCDQPCGKPLQCGPPRMCSTGHPFPFYFPIFYIYFYRKTTSM